MYNRPFPPNIEHYLWVNENYPNWTKDKLLFSERMSIIKMWITLAEEGFNCN